MGVEKSTLPSALYLVISNLGYILAGRLLDSNEEQSSDLFSANSIKLITQCQI